MSSEKIFFPHKGSDLYAEMLLRISEIKHVCLDMDGTIYNGSRLFPYTIPCLKKMSDLGIKYTFLTNNPTKSISDYIAHLHKFGIEASEERIYTSSSATIDYIKRNLPSTQKIFFLGTPSMVSEFEKAGFISSEDSPNDEPDVVVVGFDTTLTYKSLCRAAWWIEQGKPFIATNPDTVCPTDQPTVLVDCGSITSALIKATGKQPMAILGKPDPNMITGILHRHKLERHQVAMVGDRVYTDIKMAENAGIFGVLVLSGETQVETINKNKKKPDLVINHIGTLSELLSISQEDCFYVLDKKKCSLLD